MCRRAQSYGGVRSYDKQMVVAAAVVEQGQYGALLRCLRATLVPATGPWAVEVAVEDCAFTFAFAAPAAAAAATIGAAER